MCIVWSRNQNSDTGLVENQGADTKLQENYGTDTGPQVLENLTARNIFFRFVWSNSALHYQDGSYRMNIFLMIVRKEIIYNPAQK